MTTVDAVIPHARIKQSPADFIVDEVPAYLPGGEGEHLYLLVKKTGFNTLAALRAIGDALGLDNKAAGYAGMKDRHAVTTQWMSFPFPEARDVGDVASVSLDGIEILEAKRHRNKLKTGHLVGNRFSITLRDIADGERAAIADALVAAGERGVPNAFGGQRFGRHGDNAQQALAWLRGERRAPRGKKERRFYVSALQSHMFNEVLAQREADDTWHRIRLGDLAQKHDSGGVFLVDDEALVDAQARAQTGGLSPTGPMFGPKMSTPAGEIAALEQAVLERELGSLDLLAPVARIAQGARRSLRLNVREMIVRDGDTSDVLHATFVLPKGGYATTVLSRACSFDAS